MSGLRLDPLTESVPIVRQDGRPTPEFMQKWNLAMRNTGAIPQLSTQAQVSAVLDVLGSVPNTVLLRGSSLWSDVIPSAVLDVVANTPGMLLSRGASTWAGLASPSDNTQYLRGSSSPAWGHVQDSDLAINNVTTNNATTSAHGFVPKLPNDATKYYDGTGNYSVPAGGGGGGGGAWTLLASGSAASVATLPMVFTSSGYKALKVMLSNMIPSANGVSSVFRLSSNGGVSYDSGGSDYQWASWAFLAAGSGTGGSSADSKVCLDFNNNNVANTAGIGLTAEITFQHHEKNTINPTLIYSSTWMRTDGLMEGVTGWGYRNNAQVTNALQLSFNSGNVASGDWAIWGVK